ncbi:hypothetical protein PRUPE_5G100600 [Prunus persica]|uniref:BLOC-1-related complex subunit 6 C-terminal helix domain-containing protein n=1 Tax=Prunus persica TaxID=3760 RepID=A0A251P6B6_PRUPE|nr:uncharacterized protein LOC18776108 isoform X2 [Prunus persica]ONI07113.1 hypothetical protein PRUPE_5G100600 [Prunus persica]ONI07114.1 hypothetical protein PRUPE_5G100600 [Prunus persica]
MEEDGGERAQRRHPTSSETLISEPHLDPPSTCSETTLHPGEEDRTESKPELNQTEIFRTLEVVERDSLSIADSFTTLFASLRLALSEVTSNSVDHMHCFSEAAGRLQESVLDCATKGNRYINSSLRKVLRRNVDALDSGVNKLLRLP